MKERVFLSNNQDGMIEKYRMMHFLNVTDVLTNRVNCSGSTFNLTLFGRVVRDLRALSVNNSSSRDLVALVQISPKISVSTGAPNTSSNSRTLLA